MAYAYGNSLNDRKQALIKKLTGTGNNGAGGAASLSNGVPFGALPRLGFSPNARSVFGRNENFNFSGSAPGFEQEVGQVSGPNGQPTEQGNPNAGLASLNGVGPSANTGSIGQPQVQEGISTQEFSGGGDPGATHLIYKTPTPPRPAYTPPMPSSNGVNVEFLRSLGIDSNIIAAMVAHSASGGGSGGGLLKPL